MSGTGPNNNNSNNVRLVGAAPRTYIPISPVSEKRFAEIMGGSGRLAAAIAKEQNIITEVWDYIYSPKADLLDERLVLELIVRIQNDEFLGMSFDLDCTTWSRARKFDGLGRGVLCQLA